jgi:hypothetical protein
MSPNGSTCIHCGKLLTSQLCYACWGTGYTRELVFVKRECKLCHGSGRVWRCEDEFKHIVDDFKASHPAETQQHDQPPTPRHGSEPAQPTSWNPNPWFSAHPENPWNPHIHNPAVKPAKPIAAHSRKPRTPRKTGHTK